MNMNTMTKIDYPNEQATNDCGGENCSCNREPYTDTRRELEEAILDKTTYTPEELAEYDTHMLEFLADALESELSNSTTTDESEPEHESWFEKQGIVRDSALEQVSVEQ